LGPKGVKLQPLVAALVGEKGKCSN